MSAKAKALSDMLTKKHTFSAAIKNATSMQMSTYEITSKQVL